MNHLLVLNTAPELEEEMVDYLLTRSHATGFTSYAVRGHGEQQHLTIAEQVTGRRNRVQFELILPEASVSNILAGLREHVGNDIFYWQHVLAGSGHI